MGILAPAEISIHGPLMNNNPQFGAPNRHMTLETWLLGVNRTLRYWQVHGIESLGKTFPWKRWYVIGWSSNRAAHQAMEECGLERQVPALCERDKNVEVV